LASGILKPSDLGNWVHVKEQIEPDPASRLIYEDLYQEYLALYTNNRELMHHLVEMD